MKVGFVLWTRGLHVFHATLKLLLGVCVDGFEMFGPTVGIAKTFGIYSL